ncbi:MAG: hypothetical protein ACFFB2_11265 [Promethearchaeota archaeon]
MSRNIKNFLTKISIPLVFCLIVFLSGCTSPESEPKLRQKDLFDGDMEVAGNGLINAYWTDWWFFNTNDKVTATITNFNDVTDCKMRMYFTQVATSAVSVGVLVEDNGYKEYSVSHNGTYRFEFRADEFNPLAPTPSISFHLKVVKEWWE